MESKDRMSQSEKFKQAARELECEDDEAAFDRALAKVKMPADWPENTDQPADTSLDPGRH
jgi:hypothetical protein